MVTIKAKSMSNPKPSTFAELFKGFRQRSRLTQKRFAEALGVSRRTISNWQSGKTRPRYREDVLRLAEELHLSHEETNGLLRAAGYPQESRSYFLNIRPPLKLNDVFQALIEEKTRHFVGREYIFAAIEDFLEQHNRGYFIIQGEPGMGKSAILAKYVQDTSCVAHFNTRLQGIDRPTQFLESICTQLIMRYELPYSQLPSEATLDGAFFTRLLEEGRARLGPNERLVIAIDALDAVDLSGQPANANILYLPPVVPHGVYFVLTGRRTSNLPLRIDAPLQFCDLSQYQAESRRDIETYIRRQLDLNPIFQSQFDGQEIYAEEFVVRLARKSENNFMYLFYTLSAIINSLYPGLNLKELPRGLQGYYEDHWQRMGMTATPLPRVKFKIIYILAEVRQPVPRRLIAQFAEEDELLVQVVLDEWAQFLHSQRIEGETCYSLYHSSFQDFIQRNETMQLAELSLGDIHASIPGGTFKGRDDDEAFSSTELGQLGQLADRESLELFSALIGKSPRQAKFNDQDQLIELDLAGLELTELPPQIGLFQHLTHLHLSGTQLTNLPAEIAQLQQLTYLDLSGTQLISLPAITQLQQLTHIDLSETKLTSLPAEVGQLQNLTHLYLYGTQLTSLPAEVGQLQNLTHLVISYTPLMSLPVEVGQLQNLSLLDLSETQLTHLPIEVGQLQNLSLLDLSDTPLMSLPAEVGQLQNLSHLNLTNTQLTGLPVEVRPLQKLSLLELAYTQLTRLPAQVGQLQNLTHLDLTNTQLRSLPVEIRRLRKLEVLDLRGTKLPLSPQILANWGRPQTILDDYFKGYQNLNADASDIESTIPENIFSRLSPSLQEALLWAEGLRQAIVDAERLLTGYLLAALYQGDSVRQLLILFDDEATIQTKLEELVNGTTIIPVRLVNVQKVPSEELSTLRFSDHAEEALREAVRLANQEGSPSIHSRHLLAGLLAVPQSVASSCITEILGVEREILYDLISNPSDDVLLFDDIRVLSTRARQSISQETCGLALTLPPPPLSVGQKISLEVTLQPTPPGSNTFELPSGIAEVYCFVTADGFSLSTEALSIPIDSAMDELPPATFELQAHLVGVRTVTVELFIEEPEPEPGRVRIFKASQKITVIAPEASEPRAPLLPALTVRVAPQPDLVLRVASYLPDGDEGAVHLSYYLSSRLPELRFDNEKVGGVVLYGSQLVRIGTLLSVMLDEASPEDVRSQLLSLGTYLFDVLFPPREARAFREALQRVADRVMTWLIISDEVPWLPWQLVVPYDDVEDEPQLSFLGERYQLCRWIEGFGPPRYDEIPFGELALAHYKSGQVTQDEELSAWGRLLNAHGAVGISQVVKPETPVYSIHLLLHANQLMRQREIVRRDDTESLAVTSLEEEVPQARLDLRLKRPVITLSMLGAAHDEWLLPERVLPFLRAGASAVVAPWWPTCQEADQIFWATFYQLLARRIRLGDAVARARLAVRRALPQRADWLAYTAFGEPRARAYWPDTSEGYTALECLNPAEPLEVGQTYYFRASIRSRPPIWYTERLVVTDESPRQLWALFLVPDFEPPIRQTIEMSPLGQTMVQATIGITPTDSGEFLLIARLFEGREMLQALQLDLLVGKTI